MEALFALAQNDRPAVGISQREKPEFLLPRILIVFGLIDANFVFNDLVGAFVVLGQDVPGKAPGSVMPQSDDHRELKKVGYA